VLHPSREVVRSRYQILPGVNGGLSDEAFTAVESLPVLANPAIRFQKAWTLDKRHVDNAFTIANPAFKVV
jgi:hypothetical protein